LNKKIDHIWLGFYKRTFMSNNELLNINYSD
jgi:hypothetical protein